MSYPITITAEITEEYIEQLVESAGTGCAYWADRGDVVCVDDEIVHYAVTWIDEGDAVVQHRTLEPQTLANVIEKILAPGQNLVLDRIAGYAKSLDTSDIDDELADAVIQLAIFGEIVYG